MNLTATTQEPIFAQDIDLAVNIISSLNKYGYFHSNVLIFVFKVLQKQLSII